MTELAVVEEVVDRLPRELRNAGYLGDWHAGAPGATHSSAQILARSAFLFGRAASPLGCASQIGLHVIPQRARKLCGAALSRPLTSKGLTCPIP